MSSAGKSAEECPVCGPASWQSTYRGPVRFGKFPNVRADGTVMRCAGCGVQRLEGEPIDYTHPDYRSLVDADPSPSGYYKAHDDEQLERVELLGLGGLRGKTVVDVGAGAGSFLDAVRGIAARTIAIEPARHFHDALRSKGHEVFPYAKDALEKLAGQADFVTSFAVIEHVEDPLTFMRELVALARNGGTVALSTPNARDWLVGTLPAYAAFFYRVVHRWYFDADNLSKLLEKAGLERIEARFRQHFDLSNALLWLRDEQPTGIARTKDLIGIDAAYRGELARQGRTDYLYVSGTRAPS
jgi:2-polyprenyl-3-methyl-5-hydroxy-6-metoxy-1,4-benzoquinol methylase